MAPSFDRRTVLQAGGSLLLGSLAGCTALQPQSPSGVTITTGQIVNLVHRAFDVAIHILDGDETAYWRTVHVTANESGPRAGGAILHDLPSDPGQYLVAAKLLGVQDSTPQTFDLSAAARRNDASCAKLSIQIDEEHANGRAGPTISFFEGLGPDSEFWQCPTG